MLTGLFVVARIVSNPVSNVFQKQLAQGGANPIVIIAVTHALLTLVALPIVAGTRWLDLGAAFWTNMAICTVLAVAGNALLVAALGRSDLSVLGPINAYKAVLSLGLGLFLLGEVPTVFGRSAYSSSWREAASSSTAFPASRAAMPSCRSFATVASNSV